MLRILAFFLVVLAAGLGFAWLADHPGTVQLVWQGQEVGTTFTVFVILEMLLLGAAVVLFWLVRGFFKAPDRVARFFGDRRREKGYRALSAGMIAAGAGDALTARRYTDRAKKLLSGRADPMLRFLDAQTALVEGDHARARSIFETLEGDPETRLVGLRGLYLEAERLGDQNAARHYAERAVRIAPHVSWAGGAVLDLKATQGDFDGALGILEAQRDSRLVDKTESRRMRAVLLTAKAASLADADPTGSKTAAVEAQKLAPDLVPAATVAARALIRLGDARKASRILETSWKAGPHPEVAALYIHARPGDGVTERLKRAQSLAALQPGHVESHLAVAHAALDARDFALARREALAAAEKGPRESIYLLLADIEEAETGNEALVRQWMGRALLAPKDPTWMADGSTSAQWLPVSPATGRLDAFRWGTPVPAEQNSRAVHGDDPMRRVTDLYPRNAHSLSPLAEPDTAASVEHAERRDQPSLA